MQRNATVALQHYRIALQKGKFTARLIFRQARGKPNSIDGTMN
jgi:hypothetical protein